MKEIQVVTIVIVVLAVPFLVEAMRRGLGRALGAMAVMGAWLGVTLSGIRRANEQFEAGEAARDYAIIMTVALLLYFGSQNWRAARSRPVPTDRPEEVRP
jgi:hypothetical protein